MAKLTLEQRIESMEQELNELRIFKKLVEKEMGVDFDQEIQKQVKLELEKRDNIFSFDNKSPDEALDQIEQEHHQNMGQSQISAAGIDPLRQFDDDPKNEPIEHQEFDEEAQYQQDIRNEETKFLDEQDRLAGEQPKEEPVPLSYFDDPINLERQNEIKRDALIKESETAAYKATEEYQLTPEYLNNEDPEDQTHNVQQKYLEEFENEIKKRGMYLDENDRMKPKLNEEKWANALSNYKDVRIDLTTFQTMDLDSSEIRSRDELGATMETLRQRESEKAGYLKEKYGNLLVDIEQDKYMFVDEHFNEYKRDLTVPELKGERREKRIDELKKEDWIGVLDKNNDPLYREELRDSYSWEMKDKIEQEIKSVLESAKNRLESDPEFKLKIENKINKLAAVHHSDPDVGYGSNLHYLIEDWKSYNTYTGVDNDTINTLTMAEGDSYKEFEGVITDELISYNPEKREYFEKLQKANQIQLELYSEYAKSFDSIEDDLQEEMEKIGLNLDDVRNLSQFDKDYSESLSSYAEASDPLNVFVDLEKGPIWTALNNGEIDRQQYDGVNDIIYNLHQKDLEPKEFINEFQKELEKMGLHEDATGNLMQIDKENTVQVEKNHSEATISNKEVDPLDQFHDAAARNEENKIHVKLSNSFFAERIAQEDPSTFVDTSKHREFFERRLEERKQEREQQSQSKGQDLER